jgi:stress response protein YsnF
VLVIERRLLLKEEVRVRRVRSMERHQESVTLRHHEAVVTRLPVERPAVEEDSDASAKPQQPKQEG